MKHNCIQLKARFKSCLCSFLTLNIHFNFEPEKNDCSKKLRFSKNHSLLFIKRFLFQRICHEEKLLCKKSIFGLLEYLQHSKEIFYKIKCMILVLTYQSAKRKSIYIGKLKNIRVKDSVESLSYSCAINM